METLLEILLTFGFILGLAYIVAQMSRDREIGFWTLFAVSTFFTPFIGVIVGLLSKKKKDPNTLGEKHVSQEDNEKFWSRFMPDNDEKQSKKDAIKTNASGNSSYPDRSGMQPKYRKPKGNGGISI